MAKEVEVHLTTKPQKYDYLRKDQVDKLKQVKDFYAPYGVNLSYAFSEDIHDRRILTDTGWWIVPGLGLDIYENLQENWFDPRMRNQRYRRLRKDFTITYQRSER